MKHFVGSILLIVCAALRYSFGLMSFAADLAVNAVYDLLKLGATKLAAFIMKHANKDTANQTTPCAAPVLPPELYSSRSSPHIIIVVIVTKRAS